MSDKMCHHHGERNEVDAAVGSSTVIEFGDLLWQDTNQAKPASSYRKPPYKVDDEVGETKIGFVQHFLGVAMQRSRAGDTEPIRVATTGVFEFDCPSTSFELGDLIGAPLAGAALLSQFVEKVLTSKYAVGRCARRGTLLKIVLVDIRSTVMTGGVEGTSRDGV